MGQGQQRHAGRPNEPGHAAAEAPNEPGEAPTDAGSAEVVALDRFRKK
jgi:hypothetical protein